VGANAKENEQLMSDTVIKKMKGWKLTNQCLGENECEQEMKNPHPQIKPIYSGQRLVVQYRRKIPYHTGCASESHSIQSNLS